MHFFTLRDTGGGCPEKWWKLAPGDTEGQAGRDAEHLTELQVSLLIAEVLD